MSKRFVDRDLRATELGALHFGNELVRWRVMRHARTAEPIVVAEHRDPGGDWQHADVYRLAAARPATDGVAGALDEVTRLFASQAVAELQERLSRRADFFAEERAIMERVNGWRSTGGLALLLPSDAGCSVYGELPAE
jgi:hypothetical protein